MKISVVLEALTANFETDMKRAEKATARFKAEAVRSAREINEKVGTALTVGISAAVAGIGVAVKSAVDEMDSIGKTAQKIGVTTEALSALNYAAKLSDVSTGQLTGAMARLAKQQSEVAQGNEKTAELFRQLGIEATNADGSLRDTGDVMVELAGVFASMEDGADKTALAMALFGKAGKDLIPLLNAGSDGLREMTQEARDFGAVVTEDSARAAEQFNDNLTRMGVAVQGATFKLAEHLLPTLEELSAQVVDMARSPEFQENLANAIRTIGEMAIDAVQGIVSMTNALGFLWDEAKQFAGVVDNSDWVRLNERMDGLNASIAMNERNGFGQSAYNQQLVAERDAVARQIDAIEKLINARTRLESAGIEEVRVTGRRKPPVINYAALGAAGGGSSGGGSDNKQSQLEQQWRTRSTYYQSLIESANDMLDQSSENAEALLRARSEHAQAMINSANVMLDQIAAEADASTGELSVFAEQAAKNMQSAFADFLFDPFQDGIDGMLRGFVDILRRMAAEALAAQVFESIGFGKGGGGGGFDWGSLVGAVGGFFGGGGGGASAASAASIASYGVDLSKFAGFMDGGGSVPAGSWALVGERRPELVAGPATVIGGAQTAAMMQQAGGASKGTTIVNAIDPRFIAEYLAGPAGDEVFLNLVGRNARRSRAIMAGA